MKNLLYYLMAFGLCISCSTDAPDESPQTPDPVNGVSPYLLEKYTIASVNGTFETVYTYDETGMVLQDNLQIFPANLNSLSDPYIIKGGTLKLFCDSKKRVVKTEADTYRITYAYDGQDRITREITESLLYSRSDTTLYTYYNAGENNFEGTSYQTRSPLYTINTDGSPTRFYGYTYKNHYFSPSVKLKSWMTYPYNYGKLQDAPRVRYTYTTVNGTLRSESFTHTLDEQGLIIKTVHNYLGGYSEYTYSYIKR